MRFTGVSMVLMANVSLIHPASTVPFIPSGCWIDKGTVQGVALDYFWMWLAAASNIIAYVWLAILIKRANDNVHSDQVQYPGLPKRSHSGHHSTNYRTEQHVSASQMLL